MAKQKEKMEYDNGVLVCVQHRTPINKQNGIFFCGKCRKNRRAREQTTYEYMLKAGFLKE